MNDSPTYYNAVKALIGSENCGGGLTDGPLSEIIILNDVTPPTENTIQTKLSELKAEYDAQEYARKRQAEYPSIEELVVALYDTDDKSAIEAKRAEVKKKYPKPE